MPPVPPTKVGEEDRRVAARAVAGLVAIADVQAPGAASDRHRLRGLVEADGRKRCERRAAPTHRLQQRTTGASVRAIGVDRREKTMINDFNHLLSITSALSVPAELDVLFQASSRP